MPKHTIAKKLPSFHPLSLTHSLFPFISLTLLSFSEPQQEEVVETRLNPCFLYSLSLSNSLASLSFLFLILFQVLLLYSFSSFYTPQSKLKSKFFFLVPSSKFQLHFTMLNHTLKSSNTVLFTSKHRSYTLKKVSMFFLYHVTVYIVWSFVSGLLV